MRKYTVVRREAVVERIEDALVANGASIVTHANPRSAPFEITIRTPTGETLDLVCYAFTANEYRPLHVAHYADLVHPVHVAGRVFGWEVTARLSHSDGRV